MLKLRHLVSLDLTANSIKDISIFGDPSANKLDSLKELKLAQNQVGVENFIIWR
jgi:Leucine-rich repeat (LRR) protein